MLELSALCLCEEVVPLICAKSQGKESVQSLPIFILTIQIKLKQYDRLVNQKHYLFRSSKMANQLALIPIEQIRENKVALRGVNRQGNGYVEFVDSIKRNGILNPISVRERSEEDGTKYYELIDGMQRFSGACDAGLKEMPAQILPLKDIEIMEAQIMANVHKIETKPVEYSRQIQRLLSFNATMTMSELAEKLSKSPGWLSQRLGLLNLDPKIAKLVDTDEIQLSNAYALSKLDPSEQLDFLDRAIGEKPETFMPAVNQRVKEVRDAKRKGRDAAPSEFVATPHLRRLAVLKDELNSPQQLPAMIKRNGITDPVDAVKLALSWVLNMDEDSVMVAKAKYDADMQRRDEAKAKAKAEREAKKASMAAETAASVTVEG